MQIGKQLLFSLGVTAAAFVASKIIDYVSNLMVDHAEYLIGVFDNQKKLRSGTAQTVNYALHQGKVITLIHPDTMEITAPAP